MDGARIVLYTCMCKSCHVPWPDPVNVGAHATTLIYVAMFYGLIL
jgi:hypothetical protein